MVQAAQQAKYTALAASRQALEVKRGQGRPQLRTEQRSAEKIAAVSPLAARQNHRTASTVNPAALLAENQRRLETRVHALACFPSSRLPFFTLKCLPCLTYPLHPLITVTDVDYSLSALPHTCMLSTRIN